MGIFVRIISNIITLFIVDLLLKGIYIDTTMSLVLVGVVLTFLNMFIKPFLDLISLPITFLTLGLFSIIVNAAVLSVSFNFIEGAYIDGFFSAIIGAIFFSIVNSFVTKILKKG